MTYAMKFCYIFIFLIFLLPTTMHLIQYLLFPWKPPILMYWEWTEGLPGIFYRWRVLLARMTLLISLPLRPKISSQITVLSLKKNFFKSISIEILVGRQRLNLRRTKSTKSGLGLLQICNASTNAMKPTENSPLIIC